MSTPARTPRRRAAIVTTVAVGALALLAAACSNDASTRAGAETGPTTTAAPVSTVGTIPAGTTLRVGDQLDYLKTVLATASQDKDLPYTVEYSSFVGGPPMLQAFQGGALDTGFVGSTPLIFAQAAGQSLVAVAGWAPEKGFGGLITADPSITGWGALKGKRVAYQRGTASEASLLQGLDAAGLQLSDVTTVDVPITQVAAALKGGSADAGVSTEPLISRYLADTPGGRKAAGANEVTDRTSFLIASADTLADPARSAALADYLTRLVKSFDYLAANRDQLARSVFVKQYGLTPEQATALAEATGPARFIELPGDVLEPQQRLAELFAEAGQIPTEVDVRREFDTRFNDLVKGAQGS
ncbi:MAG: ABC transporter substrate-binding protein [Microthrixaceae bacterium]